MGSQVDAFLNSATAAAEWMDGTPLVTVPLVTMAAAAEWMDGTPLVTMPAVTMPAVTVAAAAEWVDGTPLVTMPAVIFEIEIICKIISLHTKGMVGATYITYIYKYYYKCRLPP